MTANWAREALLAAIELGALIVADDFIAVAAVEATELYHRAVSAGIRTTAQAGVYFLLDVLATTLAPDQHNGCISNLSVRIHSKYYYKKEAARTVRRTPSSGRN